MHVGVCFFDGYVVCHEKVSKSVRGTEYNLSNLKERQGLLHDSRDLNGKRSKSVVGILRMVRDLILALQLDLGTHHDRVQERVDEDEHPDWWRHIANAGPHAQHSPSMMKGL